VGQRAAQEGLDGFLQWPLGCGRSPRRWPVFGRFGQAPTLLTAAIGCSSVLGHSRGRPWRVRG
jgi:hypothetical protein